MRSISEYPGAFKFRLLFYLILWLVLIRFFFYYTEEVTKLAEQKSVRQMQTVINSALTIYSAEQLISGQLDRMHELSGMNPFEVMAEYNLVPAGYQGEVTGGEIEDSGWYFNVDSREVVYQAHSNNAEQLYFHVVLDYQDINQSKTYDPEYDIYKGLRLKAILH